MDEKGLKIGKILYILEAGFEYLISILVAGSFLAKLTGTLGMSDSLTGILSAVISLGCLFQLISVAIRRNRVKPLVITLSIINQLLFLFLYVTPLFEMDKNMKTGLFILAIFSAYLLYNIAFPKKISWLMSLVDDKERGIFTANKEIVSLLMGMGFSLGMGSVMDYFLDRGQVKAAFTIGALVIFALMVLHTLTMVFTVEKPLPKEEKTVSLKEAFLDLLKNRGVRTVAFIFVLYYIGTYVAVPFYGTYQINELGFSLKFVAVLGIVTAVVRIMVSRALGRYADRKSFAAMLEICFLMMAFSYLCVMFSVPKNGKVMFTLYYVFCGIANGGISSASTNLVFAYVTPEKRSDALAVNFAVSGTAGFLATLAASPVVSYIQRNGNQLFGISMYAQQFVSLIALFFMLLGAFCIRKKLL